MPLCFPPLLHLKLLHACDQWHASRLSTATYRYHLKFRRNTEGATSRSIYLPPLPANKTWVYYFNYSEVGSAGGHFEMETPITEFPLFFIRPVMPPAPGKSATNYYSASRNDMVLCLSSTCNSANGPGQPGAYVTFDDEGKAPADTSSGATVPLHLYYSAKWNDNFVSTNVTTPDESYRGGVKFNDGIAFASYKPGRVLLQTWHKKYSSTSQDYATVTDGTVLFPL
jgi:hypothetical protein